jgi:hypothetical protein
VNVLLVLVFVLLKYEYVPYPIAKANMPITNMLTNIFLFISFLFLLSPHLVFITGLSLPLATPVPAQPSKHA